MEKIVVQHTDIKILKINEIDYISLTDIAKFKSDEPTDVIANWIRNRNTIEYLGIWETLYNPGFKPLEFEGFRKEAGLNAFTLSPQKWIVATNAKGMISKSGRYGGTFAHKDIAFKLNSQNLRPQFTEYDIQIFIISNCHYIRYLAIYLRNRSTFLRRRSISIEKPCPENGFPVGN